MAPRATSAEQTSSSEELKRPKIGRRSTSHSTYMTSRKSSRRRSTVTIPEPPRSAQLSRNTSRVTRSQSVASAKSTQPHGTTQPKHKANSTTAKAPAPENGSIKAPGTEVIGEGPRPSVPTTVKPPIAPKQIKKTSRETSALSGPDYGDRHAATESRLAKEQADTMLALGYIDKAQAERLSIPWHEKGVLDHRLWNPEDLDPDGSKKHDIEIPTLAAARSRQRREDRKMKKFVEDFEAGRIDEWGRPIVHTASKDKGKEDFVVGEDEDLENESSSSELSEVEQDSAGTKTSRNILRPSRPSRSERAPGRTALWTLMEASNSTPTPTPQPKSPLLPSIKPTEADDSNSDESSKPRATEVASMSMSSTFAKTKNPASPKVKTITASKAIKPSGTTKGNQISNRSTTAILPAEAQTAELLASNPDLNTYEDYTYYQLLAVAREQKKIKSGGSKHALRLRIVEDDIAIRDGTERKELCQASRKRSAGAKRAHKTKMSDVEQAHGTKRPREGDEENGNEAGEPRKRAKVEQVTRKRSRELDDGGERCARTHKKVRIG